MQTQKFKADESSPTSEGRRWTCFRSLCGPANPCNLLTCGYAVPVEPAHRHRPTPPAPSLVDGPGEVCGSMRVVHDVEGTPYESRWCSRTSGPCPWPGTANSNDRPCAAQEASR